MSIDRSQIFRSAEPATEPAAAAGQGGMEAMPRTARGIHRLGSGIVGQAVLPWTQPETAGLGGTAMIETAGGWCRAADLRRGTLVHTLDGGLRPLADVVVQTLWPAGEGSGMLVHLAGGTFGVCDDVWLMPDQPVLIAAPVVQEVLGLPHVLLAARGLVGIGGCRIGRPEGPQQIVTLRFSRPEAVWANSGLLLGCGGTAGRAAAVAPMLTGSRAAALAELLAECPAREGRVSGPACRAA